MNLALGAMLNIFPDIEKRKRPIGRKIIGTNLFAIPKILNNTLSCFDY